MSSERLNNRTHGALPQMWWLMSVAALIALYWPTFVWMIARFEEAGTSYSHGYLIPVVSGYFVWRRRRELAALPHVKAWWAVPCLLVSVLTHVGATVWGLHFVSGFSLLGAVWGAVGHIWGARVARAVTFPVLFLFFMVPLPSIWLIHVSFRLKLLVAQLSALTVQAMGVPAVLEGSAVQLPNCRIIVDDTCSGLRSLISLIALGTLLAYWCDLKGWTRRIVLVVSAVPMAMAANWLRVTASLLVGYVYGAEAAGGTFHDVSGFVSFIVAFGGLLAFGRALEGKSDERKP